MLETSPSTPESAAETYPKEFDILAGKVMQLSLEADGILDQTASKTESIKPEEVLEATQQCTELVTKIRSSEGFNPELREPMDLIILKLGKSEQMINNLQTMGIPELKTYVTEQFDTFLLPDIFCSEADNQNKTLDDSSKFHNNPILTRFAAFTHYTLPLAMQKLLEDKGFTSISPSRKEYFREALHQSVRRVETYDPDYGSKIHAVVRRGLEHDGQALRKAEVSTYLYVG